MNEDKFKAFNLGKNMKSKLLNKYSGLNNILSKASDYWEDTMFDISKTMCNCQSAIIDDDYNDLINKDDDAEINENNQNICENRVNNTNAINEDDNRTVKTNKYNASIEINKDILYNDKTNIIQSNINKLSNIQISETTNEIYNHLHDPNLNKRIWTKTEDEMLLDFMKKTNNSRNWKKISDILKTKTPQQCTYRYNKLIEEITNRKWTRTEDIKLIELIEVHGHNWKLISSYFDGRLAQDIEARFTKKLDPNLKKSKFTEEEDELLIQLHTKLGNQWYEIASYFKNRTVLMIKNRFYTFLRRRMKNYNSIENESSNNLSNETLSNNKSNNSDKYSYSGHSDYPNRLNYMNTSNNKLSNSLDDRSSIKSHSDLAKNKILKSSNIDLYNENNKKIDMSKSNEGYNEIDFESFLKSNTYLPEFNNQTLCFDDFSKFEAKSYSFPNEEPFFDDFNSDFSLFDEKNSACNDISMQIFNNRDNIHTLDNKNISSNLDDFNIIIKGINHPSNYLANIFSNNNIQSLLNQISHLDAFFEKVFNFYGNKSKELTGKFNASESTMMKFSILNRQIDERTSSINLQVIEHYRKRSSLKSDIENTRIYIKRQIELLIQLIYTTKLKLKLFQTLKT